MIRSFPILPLAQGQTDLHDIVVPVPAPPLWPMLLTLGLALLMIGGIVWLIRHLLRPRRQPVPPPHQRALRDFDRIERSQNEMAPNQFALAVSDTLKTYISERFDDPVRYETADEFLQRISREGTRLPSAAQQELRDFLATSEELKFGNPPQAPDLAVPLLHRARQLVNLCESVNASGK